VALPLKIAGHGVHFDAPEAGRYLAPILVLPGLFQSFQCWRGLTSMLAHRGWEVYVLARDEEEGSGASGWSAQCEAAANVAAGLGDNVIIFGADIGAAIAMAACQRVTPLALGLFAPSLPAPLGHALAASRSILERAKKSSGQAPDKLAKGTKPADLSSEPVDLLDDIGEGIAFERPSSHPPAIVFAPDGDPLVTSEQALSFADGELARTSPTRLDGRWWPAKRSAAVADGVHRFLVLTLGDRVVEFPDEILAD
jgi:pimeloyl-ACP methyl ester carboxylesterase